MTGVSESTTQSLTSQIYHEITRYRKEIPISLKYSATDWWRKKSSHYPLLGKLAQYYLAIPVISVLPKRVFLTAGNVVTALRTNLKPSNVDMLVFLKKNLNFSSSSNLRWWLCSLDIMKKVFLFSSYSICFYHKFI